MLFVQEKGWDLQGKLGERSPSVRGRQSNNSFRLTGPPVVLGKAGSSPTRGNQLYRGDS